MTTTQTRSITFVVNGRPQQRGSKIASLIPRRGGGWVEKNGRPIVAARDDNAKSKDWMRMVADAAREAWSGEQLIDGPVIVSCEFFFARPKCHYGSGRNAASVKDSAPDCHIQKPDLDKLLRAILDACTGQVWRDDCQVKGFSDCAKHWTTGNEKAVVTITMEG